MDAAETKLKPCPFCGGRSETQPVFDEWAENHEVVTHTLYSAGCDECGIYTFPYLMPEEARERWNRRSDEAVK